MAKIRKTNRGVRIVQRGERRTRRGGVKIISAPVKRSRGVVTSGYRGGSDFSKAASNTGLIHPLLPDLDTYSVHVSVVFGTYNRIQHLKRCVESVRAACTNVTYEIVVGDGGSTDGSKEWLKQQHDVKYVHGGLTGAVAAFNACFREVSGR
ncbi:MAG TPA: glycosyltransferase, partial [Pyrinomonadaceae bacterium]|nr:glycosyltransferase [Pyrinomonadaceae bacterium]